MASIYGVEIKNLKEMRDHEGMTMYQGNVYLNKKLLGFWSQSYNGGIEDDYSFDSRLLNPAVEKFSKDNRKQEFFYTYPSTETLLSALVDLTLDEKDYLKSVKKGYQSSVILTDGYHYFGYCVEAPCEKEDLLQSEYHKNFVTEHSPKLFKNKDFAVRVYTRKADFHIGVFARLKEKGQVER